MNGYPMGDAAAAVDEATRAVCGSVGSAGPVAGGDMSMTHWVEVIAQSQAMINQLTAVQAVAVARVAATESVEAEDGTVEERSCLLGHVRLDAAALVAEPLGVTESAAQRRVSLAVREVTVLRSVHESMAAGTIDGWRAALVGEELRDAPDDVARATASRVVDGLAGRSGAEVRRRVRRALAAVDEDWLRQRTERARRDRCVRRWAQEPGVDAWFGTFPAEQSAVAWAAVDDLAQRYRRDASCESIEQARADAMLDLVLGRTTTRVSVQLIVPAEPGSAPGPGAGAGPGPGPGPGPTDGDQPNAVAGPPTVNTVRAAARPLLATAADGLAPGRVVPADDPAVTRALVEDVLQSLPPAGAFIEVRGLDGSGSSEVPAAWVAGHLAKAAGPTHRPAGQEAVQVVACHPSTGALIDAARALRSERYRPGAALTRFVRARDGHCRFPGCAAAARFCDLDHVRPWPSGATCASNLVLLCRRHHRVKQSPGWSPRLHGDGTMTWTTPDGRTLNSEPLDHRRNGRASRTSEVGGAHAPSPAAAQPQPRSPAITPPRRLTMQPQPQASRPRSLDSGPFSHLEHAQEHLVASGTGSSRRQKGWEDGPSAPQLSLCAGRLTISSAWRRWRRARPGRPGPRDEHSDPPPF